MKVLIVEDDLELLDVYRVAGNSILGESNCLFATSGEEAIEIFKSQRPAVVVTDEKMDKVSGSDLCDQIKKLAPMTHMVLVSAYITNQNANHFESLFDHSISKPADIPSIFDYVSYFL